MTSESARAPALFGGREGPRRGGGSAPFAVSHASPFHPLHPFTASAPPFSPSTADDRVIFRSVAVKPCDGLPTAIDALVTTTALSSVSIVRYEVGAKAGGGDEYFQVDLNILAAGGYASFTYRFFVAGTYGTAGQTQVTLANVKVTSIDLDSNQVRGWGWGWAAARARA